MEHEPTTPFDAYLNGLAPLSRRTLGEALDTIAIFFGGESAKTFTWQEVRFSDAQRLRAHLTGRYKSRTTNKHLAALRGVLRAAWRLGLMTTDDYHHAIDVRIVKISEPPAGRKLSLDELRRLVAFAETKRDAALIATLYASGARRFEVGKLRVKHYDRDTGHLTIYGKRGKTRSVTINKSWRKPIEEWLDEYRPEKADLPLFPSEHNGNRSRGLSTSGVSFLVEATRKRAKVAAFTPHDLRRTFITNLIASGADLVVVQRIAGHEQVNTTASYDRRGREAETEAIERLEGL